MGYGDLVKAAQHEAENAHKKNNLHHIGANNAFIQKTLDRLDKLFPDTIARGKLTSSSQEEGNTVLKTLVEKPSILQRWVARGQPSLVSNEAFISALLDYVYWNSQGLNDAKLMTPGPEDLAAKYVPEIVSGRWYRETIKNICANGVFDQADRLSAFSSAACDKRPAQSRMRY